jgi:SAM-dependent methyltransferase
MDERQPGDTWERGEHYERYVGRWSRRVAQAFLSWLGIPAGRRWLDVGCGTGALSEAILDRCSPLSVTAVEPSEGFLQSAAETLSGRAAVHRGSATEIPLPDSCVDVVVSGLVLNFVPDPAAALGEMTRVSSPGGTVGAYVWDYAGKAEFLRIFWDAAVELDPNTRSLDEGHRFPLCRPQALQDLFAGAGLKGIALTPIDIPTRFASFEDYWQPFLGGQGPAPSYALSLDESSRQRLRDRIRERAPTEAGGSVSLTARAWAIRGAVTAQARQRSAASGPIKGTTASPRGGGP